MTNGLAEQSANWNDRILFILQIVRYGKKEQRFLLFSALLFALGNLLQSTDWLPVEIKKYVPWLFALAVLLLAISVYRIWKQTILPPPPDPVLKPSAIKGPFSFGPQDGELFSRLGRSRELGELLGYILDDQVSLVVVMGESGCGKTSLLRSGLDYSLKQHSLQFIYWEALPTNPEAGLFNAIQKSWTSEPLPESLDEIVEGRNRLKAVIVIDQAEQLTPDQHSGFYKLLKRVATNPPPHKNTWVVAFKREFAAHWFDVEKDILQALPKKLSLTLFTPKQANEVVAIILNEAKLKVNQNVVDELIKSLSASDVVSPVDIGIGLLMLSEFTDGEHPQLNLDDFRLMGGKAGLLGRYIKKQLDMLPVVAEREPMLKALLRLIHPTTNNRLPEGLPVDALAQAAELPVGRTHANAMYLASSSSRLLEELPLPTSQHFYRLAHERFIGPLRQIAGVMLAEVAKTKDMLENRFIQWCREREGRFLLSTNEYRSVAKHLRGVQWGSDGPEKLEFIKRSKQRFFLRTAIGIVAVALLAFSVVRYIQWIEDEKYREALKNWGFTREVYDLQNSVDSLDVRAIKNVDWINGKRVRWFVFTPMDQNDFSVLSRLPSLTSLTIRLRDAAFRNLPPSPRTQASLTLDVDLLSFRNLPPLSLTLRSMKLDLKDTSLDSLELLPSTLTSLTLELTRSRLKNLPSLPPKLESLRIDAQDSELESLPLLPSTLSSLSLNVGNSAVKTLPPLPSTLTSLILELDDRQLKSFQPLPAHLTSLTLNLRHSDRMSLPSLPATLLTLTIDLTDSQLESLPSWPRTLTSLSLDLTRSQLKSLPLFPPTLTSLKLDLNDSKITTLKDIAWPKGLVRFAITIGKGNIATLEGMPPVITRLNLR